MRNWPSQPSAPEPAPVRVLERGGRSIFTAGLVLVGLMLMTLFTGSHIVFALIAIPVVVALAWSNPQAMLAILPVWMVAMGLIRRITPGGGNVTFSGDPVLIIGPAALLVMWLAVSTSREPGRLTPLARTVLIFNVIAFVGAFNPTQGTLLTGIGGLLFILVPTAAFWIGRRYADPEFVMRMIWTVAILGLIAAAYGLYQQYVGFPTWDANWIHTKGYTALSVGNGFFRAFSSFSSSQEYAVFLAVSAVAWVSLMGRKTRWPLLMHVAALATVLYALYLESQRTSVFLFVLALGVMIAARRRWRPVNVVLAGATSVVLVVAFAGALGGHGGGGSLAGQQSATQTLLQHQNSGLACPTCSGSSLSGHIKQTRAGIHYGLIHPLGKGTGSVTQASARFTSKSASHGTEFDPGNMGIAFGVPGLIVYGLLLCFALATAYRLAVRRRDSIGLFVIGALCATLFQWTNGDLYAVCFLVWMALGFADRLVSMPVVAEPEPVKVALPEQTFTGWRRPGQPRR